MEGETEFVNLKMWWRILPIFYQHQHGHKNFLGYVCTFWMVLFFEINKKLEPLSWVHDHNIGRYYRSGEHNKNSDGDGYCLPSFLKKESQNVWNFKCRLNMAKKWN